MAANPSIPIPPRTPTPPPDDAALNSGGSSLATPMTASFDPNALSPMVDAFASGDSSWNPHRRASQDISGPFNFQPTVLAKTPVVKSGVGQRRGHKYKHSSISHQIFLEPPPRAPLALPNSLPIPTLKECRGSMSREQKVRFWWSLCHITVAGYTLWSAHGSMAMTGLSHLLLFDSLGALLCVAVDVLGNFEVWKRSTVRHPFGLQRAEVVAGFALSVLLFFMGGDLISHIVTHLLETSGHKSHQSHSHDHVSPGSLDVTVLLAILATLISAFGLKNHARIGKAMRFAYIASLPSLLSNPAHFLTLSCSSILLLLPLLSVTIYTWMDQTFALAVAISMCALGIRLVSTLGSMLLMSYSGPGVSNVMRDIVAHPSVSEIEEAKFWQVHYGLCMANFRLKVTGTEESMTRMRERITSIIKERLGGGYGAGGQKWEVSIQLNVEPL
ncbi:cation diffusion zinc membrane transporter Zrg17 [Emydomyces testavorans]|uniref:Zinc transporter n=1 Tax=Emydomyces testavorans TaxID=2070801 RepID=A0AAF0IQ69_9EURO|nr:cation diffusion zinc membrane transporter Zrg17 [Emydomyces testavorans]